MANFGRQQPKKNKSKGKEEPAGAHSNNQRPSTEEKHQKANERRSRDQGDARRKPNANKRRGNERG